MALTSATISNSGKTLTVAFTGPMAGGIFAQNLGGAMTRVSNGEDTIAANIPESQSLVPGAGWGETVWEPETRNGGDAVPFAQWKTIPYEYFGELPHDLTGKKKVLVAVGVSGYYDGQPNIDHVEFAVNGGDTVVVSSPIACFFPDSQFKVNDLLTNAHSVASAGPWGTGFYVAVLDIDNIEASGEVEIWARVVPVTGVDVVLNDAHGTRYRDKSLRLYAQKSAEDYTWGYARVDGIGGGTTASSDPTQASLQRFETTAAALTAAYAVAGCYSRIILYYDDGTYLPLAVYGTGWDGGENGWPQLTPSEDATNLGVVFNYLAGSRIKWMSLRGRPGCRIRANGTIFGPNSGYETNFYATYLTLVVDNEEPQVAAPTLITHPTLGDIFLENYRSNNTMSGITTGSYVVHLAQLFNWVADTYGEDAIRGGGILSQFKVFNRTWELALSKVPPWHGDLVQLSSAPDTDIPALFYNGWFASSFGTQGVVFWVNRTHSVNVIGETGGNTNPDGFPIIDGAAAHVSLTDSSLTMRLGPTAPSLSTNGNFIGCIWKDASFGDSSNFDAGTTSQSEVIAVVTMTKSHLSNQIGVISGWDYTTGEIDWDALQRPDTEGNLAAAITTKTTPIDITGAVRDFTNGTAIGAVAATNEYPNPRVLSVAASDGTYNPGDNFDLTVTFSEAVTVANGVPQLKLRLPGYVSYASYISGSGTNTHTYRYVFQEADIGEDVETIFFIELEGATIRNSSNVDAVLIFEPPDLSGVIVEAES